MALVGSKFGSWCIRKLTPLDRTPSSCAEATVVLTIFGPVGVPLLLLTSVGRKSGERREIPLTYMREGDRLFLVGSNWDNPVTPRGGGTCWPTRRPG